MHVSWQLWHNSSFDQITGNGNKFHLDSLHQLVVVVVSGGGFYFIAIVFVFVFLLFSPREIEQIVKDFLF